MHISADDWGYSLDHDDSGGVITLNVVWGQETAKVWLTRRNAFVRLHRTRLKHLSYAVTPSLDRLCYVASAARMIDTMERYTLIAPLERSVIALPHQLYALKRAMRETVSGIYSRTKLIWVQQCRERLAMDFQKMNLAFAARRRSIERLGLPRLHDFQLTQVSEEETAWRRDLEAREHGVPELTPLIVINVLSTGEPL